MWIMEGIWDSEGFVSVGVLCGREIERRGLG